MSSDILTQLQEAVDRLSSSLYSTLGALQRDAQPASIRGEQLSAPPNVGPGQDMSKQWAAEVMAMSKIVDGLIKKLPEIKSSEKEELERVLQAMQENENAGEILRTETLKTSELLSEVRGMHAVLADVELKQRQDAKLEQN